MSPKHEKQNEKNLPFFARYETLRCIMRLHHKFCREKFEKESFYLCSPHYPQFYPLNSLLQNENATNHGIPHRLRSIKFIVTI